MGKIDERGRAHFIMLKDAPLYIPSFFHFPVAFYFAFFKQAGKRISFFLQNAEPFGQFVLRKIISPPVYGRVNSGYPGFIAVIINLPR